MEKQEDQWDASRGEKQAKDLDTNGVRIFKYRVPVLEEFRLKLPRYAYILRVDFIDGTPWLWAVIDEREPDEERTFRAFKTGAIIPDGLSLTYVGMYPIFIQEELMLYVFEELYG